VTGPPAVAVITGASRGLGAGLAEAFAARGLGLGLCARTLPPIPDGARALSRPVDVTRPGALEAFAAEVVADLGRIDLWVNNAGVLDPIGPVAEQDPGELVRQIDVNLSGVLLGTWAFARHVRDRTGDGVLVNITSGAATTPYEGWAVYCATKAAVDMLTEVVAIEEAGHGLRAYAVAPGLIDTDMQALIRASDPRDFPAGDRFRTVHAAGAFTAPAAVADFLLDLWNTPNRTVRQRVPDRSPGTP
jgi:benzil reductase ((S)-benzoin forming)